MSKSWLIAMLIFILMVLVGVSLYIHTPYELLGFLLFYTGGFFILIEVILFIIGHISKKIDLQLQIQWYISLFGGIFGGSIVVVSSELLSPEKPIFVISLNAISILFFILLVYATGLWLIMHHVKNYEPK